MLTDVNASVQSVASCKPHILVVDDDARLRSLLLRYLRSSGFWVSVVASASAAETALSLFQVDLIILDVMMPDTTGFEFLSAQGDPGRLRVPVLFLSAMGDTEHRIQGLERGAQDYLVKPFDPRELVLRIQAILKRSLDEPIISVVRLGAFQFFQTEGYLQKGDIQSFLTVTELTLLKALVSSLNKPVKREYLASFLKEPSQLRTIDVQVNRLRQQLEENPKQPQVLLTIRGEGYILKGTFGP